MDARSIFLPNFSDPEPYQGTNHRTVSYASNAHSSSSTLIPEDHNVYHNSRDEVHAASTSPLIHAKNATPHTSHEVAEEKDELAKSKGRHTKLKKPRRTRSHLILTTSLDLLLGLFATAFFVFGLLVLHFRGAPVAKNKDMAQTLVNAAKLGPTIFPILFASAMSRSLHIVMLKLLERGSRVGTLNLLAGSTSVAGTILHQAALRLPSFLGVALVIAWALSPLGGQASLRVVSLGSSTTSSILPLSYMSQNKSFNGFVTGDLGSMQTIVNGFFNAALLGPEQTKSSTVDTWNNVKVPMLEALTPHNEYILNHTWLEIPADPDYDVVYSSLIGIPVSTLDGDSTTNFTMETSYFTLDCPKIQNGTYPPRWDNASAGEYGSGFHGSTAASSIGIGGIMLSNSSTCRGLPNDPELQPRYLAWNSFDNNGARVSSLCTIWQTYVEVEILCHGPSCAATRLRNSTLPHPSRAWTWLDGPLGSCNWWLYFFQYFLRTIVVNESGTSTPLEGYLIEPDAPASPNIIGLITQLDHKVFATRFAQLMNSFWTICAGPFAVTYGFEGEAGNLAGNSTEVAVRWQMFYNSERVNTTATSVAKFQVIECHGGWLAALLLASLLLVVASITSSVLHFKLTTPELMLNWTTVVRDNPHIEDQFDDSTLDDLQRSRLLRHKRVRFGDVELGKDEKRLAIATVKDDSEIR